MVIEKNGKTRGTLNVVWTGGIGKDSSG